MKVGNIVSFKLKSAEEVIGKVVKEGVAYNRRYVILNRARVLIMQQTAEGVGLGMLPFMVSANNPEFQTEYDVKIYLDDISGELTEDSVPAPLEKAYLQQISSIAI